MKIHFFGVVEVMRNDIRFNVSHGSFFLDITICLTQNLSVALAGLARDDSHQGT
jgi:hypothetical protein